METRGVALVSATAPVEPPVRVIAVLPGDGTGSSMIFARRQVESLCRAGIEMRVFYVGSRTSPICLLREWHRLREVIEEYNPHVLHAHYGTVTALLCAVATTVPLVITFRGADLNFDPDTSRFRFVVGYLLSQLSVVRSSRVICVTSRLRERLWLGKRSALVVPTGVNMDLFEPQSKELCRDLIGWEQNERIVLFNVSKEPRTKGLDLVLAAVQIARQKIGPVRLVVTRSNVPPEQMPLYLNAADCLVLASCQEGSPNIIKEALACNLPIVSVDVGDVPERLSGVHPSKIVARDPYQIACALAEIVSLGQRSNGREIVQDCSETKIAATIADVYRSIAAITNNHRAGSAREALDGQCITTQS